MQLIELMHSLKQIEQELGGFIEVQLRYNYAEDGPIDAIVPEKQENGERILFLE